jgi:hypothetical protein
MYSETQTKIKFTLTKTEKEILEQASRILSDMNCEAGVTNLYYFDEADNVLDEITSNIEPTDDSDTYVYVFEE